MGTLSGPPHLYDSLLFALKFLFILSIYCFLAYLFFGREKSRATAREVTAKAGSATYHLAVESGAEALENQESSLFPLPGRVTLGRDESNDIQIHDATASSSHAVIESQGARLVLEDLESRNGTFVNNEKVTGCHELHEDDTVRIGMVTFRVRKGV